MRSFLFTSVTTGLFVWSGSFALAAAPRPAKLGAIGDSISTAFDADDRCDTLAQCAGRIGEDSGYSWTTGWALPDSIRTRVNAQSTVNAQRNGARWSDALGQATRIVNAQGVTHVTIQMGGNDVCRDLNDTLPTRAEIQTQIRDTLLTLVHAPAESRPQEVVIGAVPDVVSLRDVMTQRTNFAFETCQDLWDLNTSRVQVNTCNWGFFDFFCDVADFAVKVFFKFVDPLVQVMTQEFGVDFPCGYVLSSASTPEKRTLARALQEDINAALIEEATSFDGVNGVRVRLAQNVSTYQFTQDEISQLDCFHPSRTGQQNLARLTLTGSGLQGATPETDGVAPLMVTGDPNRNSEAGWIGSGSYRTIVFDFHTNEQASLNVYVQPCLKDASRYREAFINEAPSHHHLRIAGLYYGVHWRVFVQPVDLAGNAGPRYATGCF